MTRGSDARFLGTIEQCEVCREIGMNEILWEALPVPAFGKPSNIQVKVATIGINPAASEFYVGDKAKTREERLVLLRDYQKLSRSALDSEDIIDAPKHRDSYFYSEHGIPRRYYHSWFDPLESILGGINPDWSYFNGTAVHIDVVSCATKFAWRTLSTQTKKALQKNCQEHFRRTISELPPGTILLSNAVNPNEIPLEINSRSEVLNSLPRLTLWHGMLSLGHRLAFIGWSVAAKNLTFDQKAVLLATARSLAS
jgi:hypothetical protein